MSFSSCLLRPRLAEATAHGSGPLHLAAAGGHAAAVRLLLELGCELDGGDGSGATPWRGKKRGDWSWGGYMEVSIVMGVPPNGCFTRESYSKLDENWGYFHISIYDYI